MNYYPEFKDFNYTNMNMYNKINTFNNNPYNNQKDNNLYDPYNGLIRGNLFKNLYDPYVSKEPYEIKPINEQARLLTDIDALGFAMIDLNLYLDVFLNDKEKIDLYNQYRKEKEILLKEYESKYGPITVNSDSLNTYPWAWDNMPWPWDK
jgi:spore coat protein JB